MTKHNLPELSEDTVEQLVALKETNRSEFYALIYALRAAEWPLRAIAVPLKVSRTCVDDWKQKHTASTPLPEVEPLPVVPVKDRTPASKKFILSDSESSHLRNLANEASTVRRYTDINAPSRKAAEELETLLLAYSQRGASYMQLAKACGVSRSSITQRLGKHK
jgi:transcriptional regulator of acetoin/glycerol metabolism